MKIEIIPLSIRCSKRWGYGLSILGFNYNNIERAIGFNIYIDKYWDKDIRMINIYFYNNIKRIKLKTMFKSHYICNYCKTQYHQMIIGVQNVMIIYWMMKLHFLTINRRRKL